MKKIKLFITYFVHNTDIRERCKQTKESYKGAEEQEKETKRLCHREAKKINLPTHTCEQSEL